MATKRVKAVICEPYCGWYLIKFTDGTYKERVMYKPYKYVEEFMRTHDRVELGSLRYGYYAKKEEL